MGTQFERDLDTLRQKLLAMASRAEASVQSAVQSVAARDYDLARRVREDDEAIDRLEVEVDDLAIQLLAKAPLATDLRFIAVAMKISQNLERVGDEASKISNRARDLSQEAPLKVSVQIPQLAGLALQLLKSALDAFVNLNSAAARELIPQDRAVDALNREIHAELTRLMMESSENISRCLNLMVVAKSL